MAGALRSTIHRPFSVLLALALLASGVSSSIAVSAEPQASFSADLILAAVSLYLQIAVILAAAEPAPSPSADTWLREALKRRTFLRYLGTAILTYLIVALGAVVVIVGAFVMGAIVGLAPQSVVLERNTPVEALKRATDVSRQSRTTVGIVFGILYLLPNGLIFVFGRLGDLEAQRSPQMSDLWLNLAAAAATFAATIALTRTYVALAPEAAERPIP